MTKGSLRSVGVTIEGSGPRTLRVGGDQGVKAFMVGAPDEEEYAWKADTDD
jgi:hypothetical protein